MDLASEDQNGKYRQHDVALLEQLPQEDDNHLQHFQSSVLALPATQAPGVPALVFL